MLLSSRATLFAWSKADRASESSFFRQTAERWRPVARSRLPAAPDAPDAPRRRVSVPKCLRPRTAWTPWLLVN